MASRRQGKRRVGPFGETQAKPDLTLEQVDQGIYGDRLAEMTSGRVVTLDELEVLDEVQPRTDGLNLGRVEYLKQVILNGGEFRDPLDVFRIQGHDKLIVAGGFHRHKGYGDAVAEATSESEHYALPLKPLRAKVHDGTLADAIEFAEEDNLKHGQPLTDADRRIIYERRVKRGHAWATMSNRAVAAALGVSHQTIGRWRKELDEMTGPHGPVERVGKDGRLYDPSNIQAANQQRATIAERSDDEQSPAALPDREALAQKLLREVRNLPGGHRVGLQSRVIGSFPTAPEREQYKAVYAYLLAAGQIHEDVAFGVQLGPDPSATPAAPALPQGVTLTSLGTDAHSADHNADLDYAVRLRAQLERAALHAIDALAAVRQVRSIQSLYLVGDEALAATDGLLDRFEQSVQVTFEHVEQLRERVQTMRETGAPYEES
jgi:hypothetical protein